MPGSVTAADVLSRVGLDASSLATVMPRVDPNEVKIVLAPRPLQWVWPKGIVAMTMPWAIYVHPDIWDRFTTGADPDRDARLLVHELMHVEQVKRRGPVRHSIAYVLDYLRGRRHGLGHWGAYKAVRFEEEARAAARLVVEAR